MFGNKEKKSFEILLKKILIVDKRKLEICYFDNSKLTPVISGKIIEQTGWYVRDHGERISGVTIAKDVYSSYMEALNSVNK